VNSLVSNQIGKGGLLQPVGDIMSKDGVNRAERGGEDEHGNFLPSSLTGGEEAAKAGGGYLTNTTSYISGAGSSMYNSAKGAASYVGGMIGGKKDAGDKPDSEEKADAEEKTDAEEKPDVESKPDTEQTEQSKPIQQTRSMINQAEEESKQANSRSQPPPKSYTSIAQQATQPVTDAASKGVGAVQDGAKAGGSYLSSAGSTVTGVFGGKKS